MRKYSFIQEASVATNGLIGGLMGGGNWCWRKNNIQ